MNNEFFNKWFSEIMNEKFEKCQEEILSENTEDAIKNLQKWLGAIWLTGYANGIRHVVEEISRQAENKNEQI